MGLGYKASSSPSYKSEDGAPGGTFVLGYFQVAPSGLDSWYGPRLQSLNLPYLQERGWGT